MAQDRKTYGPYITSLLHMKVSVEMSEIGKNIKTNLEKKIRSETEGKCIAEGFIKPNTINIISYSSGSVNLDRIDFHVTFECMVCYPVEGMDVECICKTVTKAGIHAQVIDDEGNMPMTVFIARDHHNTDKRFAGIKENAKITAKIIGIRFELHDPYICTIGTYVEYYGKKDGVAGADKRPRVKIHGKRGGGDEDSDYANTHSAVEYSTDNIGFSIDEDE